MSAVLTQPQTQILIEQRVVLDVSWETYERLMKEHENRSAPRFTYCDGTLEIYMPTQKHERNADFLGDIVKTVADERGVEFLSLRSTTFKVKAADKGVEPDGCFYLQSYDRVFGSNEIDIKQFPPDLVIEVDITSPSINRFPIYALFGVPEIWLYAKERVQIYLLDGGKYVAAEESLALAKVTGEVLTDFLRTAQTERSSIWLKNLREWIRAG